MFSYKEDNNELTFIVNQQSDTTKIGEYQVRYRAYLQDYPRQEIYLEEAFIVIIERASIEEEEEVIEEVEITEPSWLT